MARGEGDGNVVAPEKAHLKTARSKIWPGHGKQFAVSEGGESHPTVVVGKWFGRKADVEDLEREEAAQENGRAETPPGNGLGRGAAERSVHTEAEAWAKRLGG